MAAEKRIRAQVLRPGPARSRMEALTYAGFHPCPGCGRSVIPSVSRPADPAMGGFWEVAADCTNCGTVTRYLFDEGAGWPNGTAPRGGEGRSGDPDHLSPLMAASPARTELFSPDELIALRDRALKGLARLEARPTGPEGPDEKLRIMVATRACEALRPMLELERFAAEGEATLPPEHADIRKRLEAHAAAVGVDVPPGPG